MTFTTEPTSRGYIKRGSFIIRNRCLDYIEPLRKAGIKELPIEQAIDTFGVHDRATIKAYFGSLPGRSFRLIRRTARYATGTLSMKSITLDQEIPKTEGYLEKLGLVHYERRGSHWFMVLESPILVPTLGKVREVPSEISLSQPLVGSECFLVHGLETTEKNNTHCRVRERNQSSESENIPDMHGELTPEEQAILYAKPSPKRCLDCGTIDASNPYRITCPVGHGLRSRSDTCAAKVAANG
jgi:hypothetical protein